MTLEKAAMAIINMATCFMVFVKVSSAFFPLGSAAALLMPFLGNQVFIKLLYECLGSVLVITNNKKIFSPL